MILRDISERQRAEAARSLLTAIVESSDDAITGKTLDGVVVSWNAGARRLYGYTAEEMLGQPIARIVPPDRSEEFAQTMARLRQGGPIAPFETVHLRKDGSRVDVSLTISPIRDAAGVIVGASTIGRDVTERKHLEAQLRQAQKMEAIGRLAGGVAHDFNNLLGVIIGFGELLLAGLGQDDPRRAQVEQVYHAGKRGATLTRQLLTFSRKEVAMPQVLDLNEVVATVDKMLRRVIGEDIRLVTRLDPALGHVRADPGQVEQILMNLAVNARDAMPRGGTLTIETANVDLDEAYVHRHVDVPPGQYVGLTVSDTGVGMDAEVQAHLFEPFFTTKAPGQGTGLGLATVYGIIKQSAGHIWVYSEPGQGATFKIYLPRIDAPRPPAVAAEHRPAPRGSETILLVEDEAGLRTLTRTVLEQHGYTVLEAGDGDEALRRCTEYQGPIHLLLTDVVLPGMSGAQVMDWLTAFRPELRLLFMSGYTDDRVIHHGILDTGLAFLQKPFTPTALAQKVREVLDAPPNPTGPSRTG